jgi:hypothetical protein
MARVDYYRRRVPVPLQGTVIDGHKLAGVITIPLRDGMTRTRAMALTEDMILRAKARANYRMTDADAWAIAMEIVDNHQEDDPDFPTAPKALRLEERLMVDQWIMRIVNQKNSLHMIESLVRGDDPEALTGHPRVIRPSTPAPTVKSTRSVAGRSPLHSDVTREYFASKPRPKNYRRALEQFREQCGDFEIHEYASDHVWSFRNWLDTTKDEKKGD